MHIVADDVAPLAALARRLNMTAAGVSYAAKRGEKGAKATGWPLDDGLIWLFKDPVNYS